MKGLLSRRITWIGILVFATLSYAPSAIGFAEEPLQFRDPYAGWFGNEKVSSIHTDLTRALALAAGFSEADAAKILIHDQLTDSMFFTTPPNQSAATTVYHNCLGTAPAIPDPDDRAVCPNGKGDGYLLFPFYFFSRSGICATSRPGYFGPFFHLSRTGRGELENLRKWAWGESKVLRGYAAFAWGTKDAEPIDAVCHYQVPMNIETGVAAGSLEAFSTYLHTLADSIHHRRCIEDTEILARTVPGLFPYPIRNPLREPKTCYYDYYNPSSNDTNAEEFGTGSGTYRSDEANKTIYEELVRRSVAREGKYCPLEWTAPLAAMEGSPTLEEACYHFIHTWNYQNDAGNKGDFAELRRQYADAMADAVRAQRSPSGRASLSSLSPSKTLAAGLGADILLTLSGTGITTDTEVKWNGEVLSGTYVSPRKMTARVPASKIAAEGTATVTLFNPSGCGESAGRTFAYSYPSPVLTRLTPQGVSQGSAPFTLTLTGKNFVPSSRVLWAMGGTVTELSAAYVSPKEMQVQVTSAMTGERGTARVQVETSGSRTVRSGKIAFRIR